MNIALLLRLLAGFLCLGIASITTAEKLTVPVSSGDEIIVEHFPTKGKYLIIWFAPEYGLQDNHRALARRLAEQHVEVWLTNLMDSLFLPTGSASIKALKGKHAAEMIDYAHRRSGKKIVLVGDSYATVIALRGAHHWQQTQPADAYLIGAVLFTPYVFREIPQLGSLPRYLPVVSATTIPIMIYQAQNSPVTGQLNTLLGKLRQHGSPIYTRYMPGIMSLFYQQPPTRAMQDQARPLPNHMRRMITLLERHPPATQAIPLHSPVSSRSGIDIRLTTFRADMQPSAITLPDVHGNTVRKDRFKGKVTLINFWATWCAPCLEEIPSLNRLKAKMRDVPFELISINYAEDKHAVTEFMKRVHVDFPVLLDHNGELAARWNVISYPSTFVIDTNGTIRYGVNAAIEWDNPQVVEKLKNLI